MECACVGALYFHDLRIKTSKCYLVEADLIIHHPNEVPLLLIWALEVIVSYSLSFVNCHRFKAEKP